MDLANSRSWRLCPPRRSPTSDLARFSVATAAAIAAAAWLLTTTPSLALDCPAPQPAGAPDAIQETPGQIDELAEVLVSGDISNRMPAFVHALRARHPNAPAGEIVNYLVTAYCPVVNRMAISDVAKKNQLDAFASQAAKAAF
jgi:hypothetical protein